MKNADHLNPFVNRLVNQQIVPDREGSNQDSDIITVLSESGIFVHQPALVMNNTDYPIRGESVVNSDVQPNLAQVIRVFVGKSITAHIFSLCLAASRSRP